MRCLHLDWFVPLSFAGAATAAAGTPVKFNVSTLCSIYQNTELELWKSWYMYLTITLERKGMKLLRVVLEFDSEATLLHVFQESNIEIQSNLTISTSTGHEKFEIAGFQNNRVTYCGSSIKWRSNQGDSTWLWNSGDFEIARFNFNMQETWKSWDWHRICPQFCSSFVYWTLWCVETLLWNSETCTETLVVCYNPLLTYSSACTRNWLHGKEWNHTASQCQTSVHHYNEGLCKQELWGGCHLGGLTTVLWVKSFEVGVTWVDWQLCCELWLICYHKASPTLAVHHHPILLAQCQRTLLAQCQPRLSALWCQVLLVISSDQDCSSGFEIWENIQSVLPSEYYDV